MQFTKIANRYTVSERKHICTHCPSKKYFRESKMCLKVPALIKDFTSLKTNNCPDNNWDIINNKNDKKNES